MFASVSESLGEYRMIDRGAGRVSGRFESLVEKEEHFRVEIVVEVVGYKEDGSTDLQFFLEGFDIPPAKKTASPVSGFGPRIREVQVKTVHRVIG